MTELHVPANEASYTSSLPFDVERIGAAAVYCSDGRYGDQMDEFLHLRLGLPRYDRVAIPGGAACLAAHPAAFRERGAMDKQLRFLVESHHLDRVVLIAHEDCGFYKHVARLRKVPMEQQQRADLAAAAALIRGYAAGVEADAYMARKVEGLVRFDPIPI